MNENWFSGWWKQVFCQLETVLFYFEFFLLAETIVETWRKLIFNPKTASGGSIWQQHFRKYAQSKYLIFFFFGNWRKYHIFGKTKIKENVIFSIIFVIFCNKQKKINDKTLYHANERYGIALTIIILL